jgi:hypothetical protein
VPLILRTRGRARRHPPSRRHLGRHAALGRPGEARGLAVLVEQPRRLRPAQQQPHEHRLTFRWHVGGRRRSWDRRRRRRRRLPGGQLAASDSSARTASVRGFAPGARFQERARVRSGPPASRGSQTHRGCCRCPNGQAINASAAAATGSPSRRTIYARQSSCAKRFPLAVQRGGCEVGFLGERSGQARGMERRRSAAE